jgi:branched-chain amino acid aminotransferase
MQAKAAPNYANAALARLEALKNGYDESIMLNYHGKVAEGSAENIFIVKNNQIFTPPLTSGILEGITRDSVIQIIRADGGEVIEKDLDRDDLYSADEIFMTGTAAEVKSVTQVDDIIIGDGRVGQTTRTLQKSFMDVAMGRDERFIHWLRYL